jgi:hypothetical protein
MYWWPASSSIRILSEYYQKTFILHISNKINTRILRQVDSARNLKVFVFIYPAGDLLLRNQYRGE